MASSAIRLRRLLTAIWQAVAIAAVATGLAFLISRTTSFSDLNSWTYDFTIIHAGLSPPSHDILFVDFDEQTFARIGKYPIPRSTIAQVVSAIAAQKPRVIGMDIYLSEARSEAEDKAMQAALTAAGNVVLVSQSSVGVLPPVTPLPVFCKPEQPGAATSFCIDGTPGAMGYAFGNLPIDADGYIRQADLFAAGNPPSLSFALTLAQQYTGTPIQPVDARHARFNGHLVPYSHPARKTILIGSWGREPAQQIPAWKLLAGQVAPGTFAGKLVLIGQSNDAARDRHFTPLYRSADSDGERYRVPGTQVHAATIRSLLEGTVVQPAPPAVLWVVAVLLAWLAAFLLLIYRTGWGVLGVLLIGVAACVAALVLYARARYWLPFLPTQTAVALTLPLTLGLQFFLERLVSREARAQRKQLMGLFSSYVDPAVASTIWERRNELSLAGEERFATVMFTDIRSFTAISAGKPPAEVLGWLNQYLSAMDEVIRQHGGFLNKFIGDGLMIIFGLPLTRGVSEDAQQALRAAIAMLRRVDLLNQQNAGNPDTPKLRIGIGMHTGRLMAGSIGSVSRQEYSVIGSTVNLASRLESLNKQFKTEILISESTYQFVRDSFEGLRSLGLAAVAGLSEPVPVFTIDLNAVAVQTHSQEKGAEYVV